MGPYINWNIINLTPKVIPSEAFYEIHQEVLDIISENMASLVKPGMYGAINTDDTTTKQAHYQPVINFTYWPVMGPYDNWNIIHITPKSIPSEAFDEIHQVVFDRIS